MAELATAYVSLLPTVNTKKLTAQTKGAGATAGREYGKEFATAVIRDAGSLRDATGAYVKESKRAGSQSGKGFSDTFGNEADRGGGAGGKRFGGALLKGFAALGVGALIAKSIGDTLEREKLGDKVAASLGLSNAQSAKAGTVAGKLYAGAWGGSMADVSDAVEGVMSSIEGMTNASPKRLESVTASVLDIATAFDVDASEAARNVGILMKTGLAPDADTAMNLITASLQKVPKALRGEVTDATQEYSDSFAALGLTGSQSMELLVSATENGQYGIDKMGDAIKEFTIRGTDMSSATTKAYETLGLNSRTTTNELLAGGDRAKEAFGRIISGLQGIEDPAAQSQAAIALFGTPLEDLGTAGIPKFLTSLGEGTKGLGDIRGAAKKMGDTLNDNLASRLESVKRTAQVFVTDGLTAIWNGFETGKASGSGFMGVLSTIGAYASTTLLPALKDIADRIKVVFDWVVQNKDEFIALGVAVGSFVAAMKAAQIIRGTILLFQALRAGLIAATIEQWKLNIAAYANPYVALAIAIAAVIAGLIYFFTQTKTGQKIVQAVWGAIKTAISAVTDWFTNTVVPNFQAAWDTIAGGLTWLYQTIIKPIWDGIKTVIGVAWTVIRVIFVTWLTGWMLLWQGVKFVWSRLGRPVFDAIRKVASAVWNWLKEKVFAPIGAGFKLMALGLQIVWQNVIKPVWNGIKSVASAVWNWLKQKVFAPIGAGFKLMALGLQIVWQNVIKPVWDGIKSAASAAWHWIRDKALNPLSKALDAIGDVFDATKDLIKTAWDKIKAVAAKPINFIIETVYTEGIKKTWDKIADAVGLDLKLPVVKPIKVASGGVLPGYTPGRDVHDFYSPTGGRLALSGGEAIMRPEFTRAVGGAAGVARLNAAARAGQEFKDGGVWGWAGDAWDTVKGIASKVAQVLSNPVKALGTMIATPLRALLENVGGGTLGDIAAQLPRNAVTALIDKAKSLVSGLAGKGGGRVAGGPVMGWQNMWRIVSGAFPGATLNSAYRPGAVTAVGTQSYHALGRAIDVNPSMEIFNWLAKSFPGSTELIYSPANNRQLYKGQPTLFGEPTRGDHWNHVHWAMRNGGILPDVFDRGGWWPSGGLGVNMSGHPEAVLSPAESRALKGGLSHGPLVGTMITADPSAAIRELEAMQRRAAVRAGLSGRR